MGKPKNRVWNTIVPGPLEQHAPGYRPWLLGRGYALVTTASQLQLMAHVSRWLEREGLTAAALAGPEPARFLAARHAAGTRKPETVAGLRPLLDYLGELGVLTPGPPQAPLDAAAVLIAEFAEYLRSERGLAESTVTAYSSRAARFLARYAPDGDPAVIAPGDVTAAVLADASGLPAGSGQNLACALRAFLRYCHMQGLIASDVSAAAMAVTGRRVTMLPRGLEPGQVAALLAACDRGRPDGRRDYAVILLLARLGLRAGETARLRLDDINWRAGALARSESAARAAGTTSSPSRLMPARRSPPGCATAARPSRSARCSPRPTLPPGRWPCHLSAGSSGGPARGPGFRRAARTGCATRLPAP
jgi:integrase/recombinase XerD